MKKKAARVAFCAENKISREWQIGGAGNICVAHGGKMDLQQRSHSFLLKMGGKTRKERELQQITQITNFGSQ